MASTETIIAYLKASAQDNPGGSRDGGLLHCGRASSHFFFRLLHVTHPVLVRWLKGLLCNLGPASVDACLRSLPYSDIHSSLCVGDVDVAIENFSLRGGGITDCAFALSSGDDLRGAPLPSVPCIDTTMVGRSLLLMAVNREPTP